MAKQPHNEHELELALTRLAGSNIAAVEYRDIMAGVVLGQMLPAGTVVKGGTSMRLRLGPGNSRVTVDFDAARNIELDDYIKSLRSLLEVGWADFTGVSKVSQHLCKCRPLSSSAWLALACASGVFAHCANHRQAAGTASPSAASARKQTVGISQVTWGAVSAPLVLCPRITFYTIM